MIWPPVKLLLTEIIHLLTLVLHLPRHSLGHPFENIQSSNTIEIYCKSCKDVEFYETDESDVDELPRSTCKVTNNIQEDLRAEPGNKWKQEKSIRMMMTSVLQKGNNLVSKNEERALGKLDKALNIFANMALLQNNKMQWRIMRYIKITSPQVNTSFIRISTQLENKRW